MEFPVNIENKYELISYNKDELAQIIAELGTPLTYAIKSKNLRADKMAVLRTFTTNALPELVKAYTTASSEIVSLTPFSLSFQDMFKDEGVLQLDVMQIVKTEADKVTAYPLKNGAVNWDGKLKPPLLNLAIEVASDTYVTATTINKTSDIVNPMFKYLENTDQRTASLAVVNTANNAGLLKMKQMTSYELAGAIYQASEKSHPHTSFAFINDVTKRDPKSIQNKSKYNVLPGYNQALPDPKDGARRAYNFQTPPIFRCASGGAYYNGGPIKDTHLFSLHQQFNAAIGDGSSGRGGFHSAFQFNAPAPPALSKILNTLYNVKQLNLKAMDLVVLLCGDTGLAGIISHNLRRSVACYGPGMTRGEIRAAWEANLPITFNDVATLSLELQDGEKSVRPRLILYGMDSHNLTSGSTVDDNYEKGKNAFLALTTGAPSIVSKGNVMITFARPAAMGSGCLSREDHFEVDYEYARVKFYVGLNMNVSSCCVMFCTDKELLKQNISCIAASTLTALYMFNYATWRWHKMSWYPILQKMLEGPNVFQGVDLSVFSTYTVAMLPASKVKSGFDLNYLSEAGAAVHMDYDVKHYEMNPQNVFQEPPREGEKKEEGDDLPNRTDVPVGDEYDLGQWEGDADSPDVGLN